MGGTVGKPSPGCGGGGLSPGNRHDYDREYCVDGFAGRPRPSFASLRIRISAPRAVL